MSVVAKWQQMEASQPLEVLPKVVRLPSIAIWLQLTYYAYVKYYIMFNAGMSDSEILTDSDSDSDSDFFCRQ